MNEQLYKLINFNEKINIVDIGASPLLDNVNKHKKKGEPEFSSYQNLMNSNYFNLICVEGHEPAYNDLKKLIVTEKIKTKRGIYLLPSIITTFALFAGFYSIIASINGDFTLAAISIS